jgi:CTP-dependent riboflavin kinase
LRAHEIEVVEEVKMVQGIVHGKFQVSKNTYETSFWYWIGEKPTPAMVKTVPPAKDPLAGEKDET